MVDHITVLLWPSELCGADRLAPFIQAAFPIEGPHNHDCSAVRSALPRSGPATGNRKSIRRRRAKSERTAKSEKPVRGKGAMRQLGWQGPQRTWRPLTYVAPGPTNAHGLPEERAGRHITHLATEEQKTTVSRPVCWTAAGPVLSLEGWKPTTSSASGFNANSGLPPGCASPRNGS